MNNYRYSSALKAQGLVAATKERESSNSIRDMIVAYFAALVKEAGGIRSEKLDIPVLLC